MADLLHSKYFSIREFPGREEELRNASARIFDKLDILRETLGEPIYPSPVAGALARFDGSRTSRHFAVDRLSDAIDIFFGGTSFLRFYNAAIACGFGGIGIYPYTKFRDQNWPMMHVDLRPNKIPLVWARNKQGEYIYPHKGRGWEIDFWHVHLTYCSSMQFELTQTDRE